MAGKEENGEGEEKDMVREEEDVVSEMTVEKKDIELENLTSNMYAIVFPCMYDKK